MIVRVAVQRGTLGREKDGKVPVKADYFKDGLAITRLNKEKGPQTWAVTHVESGRAVATAFSKNNALKGIKLLLPLLDWNQTFDAIFIKATNDRQLFARLKEARRVIEFGD